MLDENELDEKSVYLYTHLQLLVVARGCKGLQQCQVFDDVADGRVAHSRPVPGVGTEKIR